MTDLSSANNDEFNEIVENIYSNNKDKLVCVSVD